MSRKQGKQNQRKLEKKRKAERAKRLAQSRDKQLAYHGQKYHTPEFVPVQLYAEIGIIEAFVTTERRLTDLMVEAALTQFIRQLRQGVVSPLDDSDTLSYTPGQEPELIIASIRRSWRRLAEEQAMPGLDSLVGVLRSILGSIDVHKTAGANSRGYLRFLEGFLEEVGVSVEIEPIDEDDEEAWNAALESQSRPAGDDDQDEDDDAWDENSEESDDQAEEIADQGDLLSVGRVWHQTADSDVEMVFRTLADAMIQAGEAPRVAAICRQLIQEGYRPAILADLTAIARRADRAAETASRPSQ